MLTYLICARPLTCLSGQGTQGIEGLKLHRVLPQLSWISARNHRLCFGRHYLSDATCLIQGSFVSCVFRRVKDHHNLLHYLPLLKNSCVRQVVLDKLFLLNVVQTLIHDLLVAQTSRAVNLAYDGGGAGAGYCSWPPEIQEGRCASCSECCSSRHLGHRS